MRYFHDTPDGGAIRLGNMQWVTLAEFLALGGVPSKANRDCGRYCLGQRKDAKETGDYRWFPVTRAIEFKRDCPSLHECNAKCMNGHVNGRCECRCGGKNHGRSSVPTMAVA